jgi:hypothetical protein
MKKLPAVKLPVPIPAPKSPRPWHRKPNLPPVYDAGSKVVSFIENAEFLFHVEQCHDDLIAALQDAKRVILRECKPGLARHDNLVVINAALKKARGKL